MNPIHVKNEAIRNVLHVEGGYVNDPRDSGGETNHGVTAFTARSAGYEGSMREMTRQQAIDIYARLYWDANNLDAIAALSPCIAEKVFDIAVNMGNGRAGEFLQRIINVMNNRGTYYADIRVDGAIGARTAAALESFLKKRGKNGESVIVKGLQSLQGAFYITLAERRTKDEAFVYGWLDNRVA